MNGSEPGKASEETSDKVLPRAKGSRGKSKKGASEEGEKTYIFIENDKDLPVYLVKESEIKDLVSSLERNGHHIDDFVGFEISAIADLEVERKARVDKIKITDETLERFEGVFRPEKQGEAEDGDQVS